MSSLTTILTQTLFYWQTLLWDWSDQYQSVRAEVLCSFITTTAWELSLKQVDLNRPIIFEASSSSFRVHSSRSSVTTVCF